MKNILNKRSCINSQNFEMRLDMQYFDWNFSKCCLPVYWDKLKLNNISWAPCLINSQTLKIISWVESFLYSDKQGTPEEVQRIQRLKYWVLTNQYRRCPWCNGYRRRKWTRRHEFKSSTRVIAFHIALIPLGKVWILLFSLQLWVNRRSD